MSIPSLPATIKSDSSTLRPAVVSAQSPVMSSSSSAFSSTNISAASAAAAAALSASVSTGANGQQITIQKIPGLSVFLTKIYNIFSIREYSEKDWCCWGSNGDTIVFKSIEQFSKNVLPKYFKHSNFQSFVRQLNMYDFRKTAQNPNHVEFQHTYFKRNQPELLINIKRKPSRLKTLQYKADLASRGIAMPSSGSHGASTASENHAFRKGDARKTGGSAGHGLDSENDYDDDEDGDDESENEHDEFYDPLVHDAGGGQQPPGRGGRGAHSTGAVQLESRIANLEAESTQLKMQVDSLQWQSSIFRSILDEMFLLLSRPAGATNKTSSSEKLYGNQIDTSQLPEPTLFTNDFVDEIKRRIFHTVVEKTQHNRFNVPYTSISNQVHAMLYPFPSSSATDVAANSSAGHITYPIGSIDFGMSLENVLPNGGLHALDGMELSRLRGRSDIGNDSDHVMQPTSFDLAASSVLFQPSSLQGAGRLNSFYGTELPPAPFATSSSLELLSTSADILTERDRMSSYDYSNFASTNTETATIVGGNDDVDQLPLSKKQRNSDISTTEEAHSSSVNERVPLPGVSTVIGPSVTATEDENLLSRQEPVGPNHIIRLDSTFTNLSRLDSLDSALSTIFKNIEDSKTS
eukprot:gene21999-30231_t